MHILINKNYLTYNKLKVKCAIGKKGLGYKRKEGDLITPKGQYKIKYILYREDRVKISTSFKKKVIKKNMAWCDDPNNKSYNKLIFTNNKKKEKLYRKDNLYNIIVVINYNVRPTIKNKGSAIFIHLARKNYSGTMGCIGLKKNDLINILKTVTKKTKNKIVA